MKKGRFLKFLALCLALILVVGCFSVANAALPKDIKHSHIDVEGECLDERYVVESVTNIDFRFGNTGSFTKLVEAKDSFYKTYFNEYRYEGANNSDIVRDFYDSDLYREIRLSVVYVPNPAVKNNGAVKKEYRDIIITSNDVYPEGTKINSNVGRTDVIAKYFGLSKDRDGYYNLSGLNIFEVAKVACDGVNVNEKGEIVKDGGNSVNEVGFDLFLGPPVLESIKDKYVVTKEWNVDGDLVPDNITVQLYRTSKNGNQENVGNPITITARDNWSASISFNNSIGNNNGNGNNNGTNNKTYTYGVREIAINGVPVENTNFTPTYSETKAEKIELSRLSNGMYYERDELNEQKQQYVHYVDNDYKTICVIQSQHAGQYVIWTKDPVSSEQQKMIEEALSDKVDVINLTAQGAHDLITYVSGETTIYKYNRELGNDHSEQSITFTPTQDGQIKVVFTNLDDFNWLYKCEASTEIISAGEYSGIITNTLKDNSTAITGTKTFDMGGISSIKVPEKNGAPDIKLDVYKNGALLSNKAYTLKWTKIGVDEWSYDITGLDKYCDSNNDGKLDKLCEYTVKEAGEKNGIVDINGYEYFVNYNGNNITNRLDKSKLFGSLTITKKIDANEFVSGMAIFAFKIEGPSGTFYKTIAIPQGGEGKKYSVTLDNLRVGNYKVTELNTMRYKAADDKIVKDVEVVCGANATVDFTNNLKNKNNFSHTDMVINHFTKNGKNIEISSEKGNEYIASSEKVVNN